MGVEYRVLLIPRDNTFRPEPDIVRRLLDAWREAGFLPHETGVLQFPDREESFERDSDLSVPECILSWSIEDRRAAGLIHPLADIAEDPEQGAYYDLRLHFADDFVEIASEMVDPPSTLCTCGQDLLYEAESDMFYAMRIRQTCPRCGEGSRPQEHAGIYRDPVTGEERELMGGANHRFAIVIDCGKHWRTVSGSPPSVSPRFAEISTAALGGLMYEVGDVY